MPDEFDRISELVDRRREEVRQRRAERRSEEERDRPRREAEARARADESIRRRHAQDAEMRRSQELVNRFAKWLLFHHITPDVTTGRFRKKLFWKVGEFTITRELRGDTIHTEYALLVGDDGHFYRRPANGYAGYWDSSDPRPIGNALAAGHISREQIVSEIVRRASDADVPWD